MFTFHTRTAPLGHFGLQRPLPTVGACLCRRLSGASGARTPRWSVPTVHSTTVEASGRFTFTEASRRFTPTARPLQVNVGGKSLMLGCCCSRILLLFCCYCCNSSTLFSPQRYHALTYTPTLYTRSAGRSPAGQVKP